STTRLPFRCVSVLFLFSVLVLTHPPSFARLRQRVVSYRIQSPPLPPSFTWFSSLSSLPPPTTLSRLSSRLVSNLCTRRSVSYRI
ncbi:hypothetical protein B0H14DRAFT_2952005, partial [Mycena olivaceomarginata]